MGVLIPFAHLQWVSLEVPLFGIARLLENTSGKLADLCWKSILTLGKFSFLTCKKRIIKKVMTLAGMAQWIEHGTENQRVTVDSRSGHMLLVCGPGAQ